MDFGDTVYATATVSTISVLLFVPLDIVFGMDLYLVGRLLSVLIAALITGVIFAGKLADAKILSIAKIMVLAAVVIIFVEIGQLGATDSIAAFKDSYLEANPGALMTNIQWATLMEMYAFQQTLLYVVLFNAIGFVGVYLGSMLKPKKT